MSSSGFSEIEMMYLAKLSYFDVPGVEYTHGRSGGHASGDTMQALSLYDMLTDKDVYNSMVAEFGENDIKSFAAKVKDKDYTIVKATNDRDGTGFSALAIEGPDKGNVTVAVRGTESFNMDYDSKKDVMTDAQLGISPEADQQTKMNEFMQAMEKYDSISLTGHSLGGNLVVSGAICFKYKEKIEGVYTYNAPGQNALYKSLHKKDIEEIEDRIKNYINAEDIVSDINDVIGNVEYVETNGSDGLNHSLASFKRNENGFSYTDGKSAIHGTIHDLVDVLVPSLPVLAVSLLCSPLSIIVIVAETVAVLYVANVAKEALNSALNKLKDYISSNYSYGSSYASSNPFILVDTYKLSDYATRLSRINSRVSSLDSRLKTLYSRVCSAEDLITTAKVLWNLLNADILFSYSKRLKKCAQYLNETSEDFARTEKNINSRIINV